MRTIHIYDDFSICYFTVSEHWSETEISEIPACAGMTDNKKKSVQLRVFSVNSVLLTYKTLRIFAPPQRPLRSLNFRP